MPSTDPRPRTSGEHGSARKTRAKTLLLTALAVFATALIGNLANDTGSTWYRELAKPSWQPPGPAFALVWTPLYILIAYAGARAIDRARPHARRGVILALAVNLVLNAGWSVVFFAFESPEAALAEILLLNLANALLVHRAWSADRTAGILLLPYAAWVVFATALNGAIVRLN
ncbi:TspO/MBR family protein [Actinocorallia sp. B10E7]|uniref:TspO/MBR family protein n=1 Tax=Actinocorallia sp. B10E7 TaxID=3153558 RepID=UPI00325E969C